MAPLPPGPSLFAFARRMVGRGTEALLPMLEAMQADYGDVVRLPTPYRPTFLVAHPDALAEVLVKRPAKYGKDWVLRRHRAIFGNGLLTSEGPSWLAERRLLQPQFHRARVEGYGASMVALTERAIAGWRDGAALDAQAAMMSLTLEIVVRTLFGGEVEASASGPIGRTGELLEGLLAHYRATMAAIWPLPDWLPTATNRRYRAAAVQLRAIVDQLVAGRRAASTAGATPTDDLLQMLLDARDEAGTGLDDRRVGDELITFLVAGHETTAQTLAFTWQLLSQAPAVNDRLRAELKAVLGDRPPTPADLPALPYLAAVVKEAMRLYPAAPNLGREALVDDELLGYRIPAGTTLLLSTWLLHRDRRFFAAPGEFQPQRWLGSLEAELPRFAYLPFGGGSRQCIGNAFALMEAKLILATIAQRFELTRPLGAGVSLRPSITLRAAGGLPVVLRAVA